jgi:hypothetical protein
MIKTFTNSRRSLPKILKKLFLAITAAAGYTFFIILDIFFLILDVLMMPLFLVVFLVLKASKK